MKRLALDISGDGKPFISVDGERLEGVIGDFNINKPLEDYTDDDGVFGRRQVGPTVLVLSVDYSMVEKVYRNDR